jgi:DnaJ domain
MPTSGRDPYQTLGVSPGASDEEVRSAYRRLVQRHHPDHNGGSAEAERRFEEVQDAYARVKELRTAPPRTAPPGAGQPPPGPAVDPDLDARLADMERQLRDARAARERARQAARREAAESDGVRRPSDEELGYVTTDDSFSKILADARSELSDRLSEAQERPVKKQVGDLIDEVEGLVSKLTGERPPRSGK